MKLNRLMTMCAVAVLVLSASSLMAQDNGNNNQRGQRGGFGRWDPAQMQQRILDRYQQELGFTNATEWDAVKPLVQKVMEARRDAMSGMRRGFFGPRNRGGRGGDQARNNNRPRGGFFGQPNPDAEALQKALDDNASASQIKDLLAKYKASQEAKREKLKEAQDNLRKVLTIKQEAQATLMGLLD